jgi:hypothetical protein
MKAVTEMHYFDQVKEALVEAVTACDNSEHYAKSFITSPTVVQEPHRWIPWKKISRTIPAERWRDGVVETYNTGEYVGTGDTDHFVIHLWFNTQWIEERVANFLAEHGYQRAEHGHYISDSLPRRLQNCGFIAFERRMP